MTRTIPYLKTLTRTITYLNTLSRTKPYLNTLTQTIPDLNILNRTIPYLNTLNRTMPYRNTLPSAANQIRVFRHSSRQPIRIKYYVTRELRLKWSSLLGSRLDSARHSLS